MTAPERIFANPYYGPRPGASSGIWKLENPDGRGAEYVRADLATPPLSAALKLPEVAALVEALRGAIEAIDAAYDGPDDNGAYSTRERAALSAIDAAKGGE